MQKLAASCMLIEAIGEGIKKIDQVTKGELLQERPRGWAASFFAQKLAGFRNNTYICTVNEILTKRQ